MSIFRISLDYDLYKAIYIGPDILIDILQKQNQGQTLTESWCDNVTGDLSQFNETAKDDLTPDVSFWNNYLVFSEKAYIELHTKLDSYGVFLPINVGSNTWYAFDISHSIEADEKNSHAEIVDGVLVGVDSLSFNGNASNKLIFTTSFDNNTRIFCSDTFKDIIASCQFTGLIFSQDLVG